MASELSPQSIRDVRFREKLRGYNPEDVDAFVTSVAATVESLHRRINELLAQREDGVAARASTGGDDLEDSLRRTLVLAQRTADLAVKEAQEEAGRIVGEAEGQRAEVLAEIEQLRTRTIAELENELSGYRQRLHAERDALQRDVHALQGYVEQERERLRIYFAEQLQRVEQGVPTINPPPPLEAPDAPTPPPAAVADAAAATVVVDEPGLPEESVSGDAASDAVRGDSTTDHEDDPFLAELRRAVNDNEPLGPRDDVDVVEPADPAAASRFDFLDEEEGGSRFLRRRR